MSFFSKAVSSVFTSDNVELYDRNMFIEIKQIDEKSKHDEGIWTLYLVPVEQCPKDLILNTVVAYLETCGNVSRFILFIRQNILSGKNIRAGHGKKKM